MVQSNENAAKDNTDANEIDRIMKEIEDLEKKIDSTEDTAGASASAENTAESEVSDNVVPLRPTEARVESSLAESDAVPVSHEPLMKTETAAAGQLALKVGGCTEVSLEFARENLSVTVSCTSDGLKIVTNQGAEFKLPFKS